MFIREDVALKEVYEVRERNLMRIDIFIKTIIERFDEIIFCVNFALFAEFIGLWNDLIIFQRLVDRVAVAKHASGLLASVKLLAKLSNLLIHLRIVDERHLVSFAKDILDFVILGAGEIDSSGTLQEEGADEDNEEERQSDKAEAIGIFAEPIHLEVNGFLLSFVDEFVAKKKEGWERSEDRNKTKDNAFTEDEAHIAADGEAHENEDDKADDGSDGARRNGTEGITHCAAHSSVFVWAIFLLLFLAVARRKHNSVIHGERHLKNSSDGVSNMGDIWKNDIGSHIHYDGKHNRDKEEGWLDPGFAHDEENDERKGDSEERDWNLKDVTLEGVNLAGFGELILLFIFIVNGMISLGTFFRIGRRVDSDFVASILVAVVSIGLVVIDGFNVLDLLDVLFDSHLLICRNVSKHHFIFGGVIIMKLVVHDVKAETGLGIGWHIRIDVFVDFDLGGKEAANTGQSEKDSKNNIAMVD